MSTEFIVNYLLLLHLSYDYAFGFIQMKVFYNCDNFKQHIVYNWSQIYAEIASWDYLGGFLKVFFKYPIQYNCIIFVSYWVIKTLPSRDINSTIYQKQCFVRESEL